MEQVLSVLLLMIVTVGVMQGLKPDQFWEKRKKFFPFACCGVRKHEDGSIQEMTQD